MATFGDAPQTKQQAQARADAIRRFREELHLLERENVLALSDDQREAVAQYHHTVFDDLARRFDIDCSETEKQMSIGMRVASLVGAVAFSAAVVLFFTRFWGVLSTPMQLAVLTAGPILGAVGVDVAARKEKTLYFASIVGVVAFAAFVLDVSMTGTIFNFPDSPLGFLVEAAFALALAYAYRLPWLLFIGAVCASIFFTASLVQFTGIDWTACLLRPEGFILSGGLALMMATMDYVRGRTSFGGVYRFLGWVGVLFPLVALAGNGGLSYLPMNPKVVATGYLMLGFVLGSMAVWSGIRSSATVIVNTGTLFLALLIFTKLWSWWWDWMPRYLFFFLLGVIAIGILVVLRKLRQFAARTA